MDAILGPYWWALAIIVFASTVVLTLDFMRGRALKLAEALMGQRVLIACAMVLGVYAIATFTHNQRMGDTADSNFEARLKVVEERLGIVVMFKDQQIAELQAELEARSEPLAKAEEFKRLAEERIRNGDVEFTGFFLKGW